MLRDLDVTVVRSNQFLCHYDDFAEWANGRKQLKMEDFYRWQRRRLGYLMDGDEPATGRWNYDDENRERPPKTGNPWPEPQRSRLDDLDRAVLDDLPDDCWGAEPDGTWATITTRCARLGCATSSTTCCRCSARTRTRWSNARGTSPTRCCRRT